jgi:radical SAM superfamily enzyme with C-terminal helix-hairpin-helix motif
MASNQNGIHLSETFHLHYNLLHSELSENSELATINQRQTISLITVTLVTINLYQNISRKEEKKRKQINNYLNRNRKDKKRKS